MARSTNAIATLLLAAATLPAQTTAPAGIDDLGPFPRSAAKAKEWLERGWATSNTVLENLSADDSPAVRTAEIARTKMLLRARPAFVTRSGSIAGLLLYKKMYVELIDVADYGITCHPEATDDIAQLQKYKARALAGLGKKDESLAAAKAYFNVAPMGKTADALKLLTDLLAASDADAVGRVEAFKAEQTAGAEPVSADKLKAPIPRAGVLASVKIDSAYYDKVLATRLAASYFGFTGRGNLLLLADRPDDALKAFESAQGFAGEREAAAATENIARAMRAADGSIGRANAWIGALDK